MADGPAVEPPLHEPRMRAAVELVRHTGAAEFQIRYSEEDQPPIWVAVAAWRAGGDSTIHDAAASPDPVLAVLRLCQQVIDGGRCRQCHKPSGIWLDDGAPPTRPVPVCWTRYHDATETFRRDCERRAAIARQN